MDTFKQILQYFDDQQWEYYLPKDEKSIAMFGIETQNGKFHCITDVDEEDTKIIFFSTYPINVPKKTRKDVAELIIRINYVLFFGGFEMDFKNGEIRFKTSVIYEDGNLTMKMIEHIVKDNITIMNNYFGLLNSLIAGKITIEKATEDF